MKRSGSANLPLHYGYVPQWLYERMAKLGLAVFEVLLADYGKDEVLRRMSDPFWFQSLGAVTGYYRSRSMQAGLVLALSRALNYDFFSEILDGLPEDFPRKKDVAVEAKIAGLEAEVADMKKENALMKELFKK